MGVLTVTSAEPDGLDRSSPTSGPSKKSVVTTEITAPETAMIRPVKFVSWPVTVSPTRKCEASSRVMSNDGGSSDTTVPRMTVGLTYSLTLISR